MKLANARNLMIDSPVYISVHACIITSDKGGDKCFSRVCLSVCLLARLLKNA